jgi:type IV pilus assembly protein PilA
VESARERSNHVTGDQSGFALVELMVVVVIVGILIMILLGTYLGARSRAADRAVQSDLRSALAVAIGYYVAGTTYMGLDVPTATVEEPTLRWVTGVSPGHKEIDIQQAAGDNLLLIGQSDSGTFFCLAEVPGSPVTQRGTGNTFADVDSIPECVNGW